MNKLAIVIPVYNEEDVIEKNIKIITSYLQNLIKLKKISKDSFILVVDDGSKDNTLSILLNSNNKYLKIVITFVTSWISLTMVEFLVGIIINKVFGIDMWNYTKKEYNFGKYICLELSIIWGLLGTLFIYYVKDFFDKFIKLIPNNLVIVIIILNCIDTLFIFLTK